MQLLSTTISGYELALLPQLKTGVAYVHGWLKLTKEDVDRILCIAHS